MAIYSDLSKLSRVKLPSGTTYALVDVDGRSLIAGVYSTEASYTPGTYVIYNDNLYKCTGNCTGAWDSTKWQAVTVTGELNAIKASISGGIHFRGYTTTSLKEDSTTNPIQINGSSYTAETGDLVIETPPAYATNKAYSLGEYVTYSNAYYGITADITASANTGWEAVSKKLVSNEPEFIFDGTHWNELGALNPQGLGALAYKDNATGQYVKPTGTGSVSIPTISPTFKKLSTITITGTNGTVNASEVTGGTEKDIAKAGTATRYGTANVGTAVTYGTANKAATATVVGNADVGTEIQVGTTLTGTTSFNTDAIKSATLTGTTSFNTDAIKSATLTGTTTFTTSGVVVAVDGDCIEFSSAATGTVTIETAAAAKGTVTIETTAAGKGTVTLSTTGITPAAQSSTEIYGAVDSTSTLTPATEAPNDQTLIPAVSNGKLTGSYSITPVTPAKVASSATTVASGALEAGNQLLSTITIGTESTTVTVGTTTDTTTVS